MKPLLEVHEGSPVQRPSHGECPGGLLLLTRSEYDEMISLGERFITSRSDMPDAGRGDARLRCSGTVLRWERGGRTYYAALCASCTDAEKRMRDRAAKRLNPEGR